MSGVSGDVAVELAPFVVVLILVAVVGRWWLGRPGDGHEAAERRRLRLALAAMAGGGVLVMAVAVVWSAVPLLGLAMVVALGALALFLRVTAVDARYRARSAASDRARPPSSPSWFQETPLGRPNGGPALGQDRTQR